MGYTTWNVTWAQAGSEWDFGDSFESAEDARREFREQRARLQTDWDTKGLAGRAWLESLYFEDEDGDPDAETLDLVQFGPLKGRR